jgi:hypothetical protein
MGGFQKDLGIAELPELSFGPRFGTGLFHHAQLPSA